MGHEPVYRNHVRRFREQRRMLQRELAEKAGITRQHLCHIEKGHWQPRFDTQRKIVKALGFKVGEITKVFPQTGERRKAS